MKKRSSPSLAVPMSLWLCLLLAFVVSAIPWSWLFWTLLLVVCSLTGRAVVKHYGWPSLPSKHAVQPVLPASHGNATKVLDECPACGTWGCIGTYCSHCGALI